MSILHKILTSLFDVVPRKELDDCKQVAQAAMEATLEKTTDLLNRADRQMAGQRERYARMAEMQREATMQLEIADRAISKAQEALEVQRRLNSDLLDSGFIIQIKAGGYSKAVAPTGRFMVQTVTQTTEKELLLTTGNKEALLELLARKIARHLIEALEKGGVVVCRDEKALPSSFETKRLNPTR